MVDEADDVKVEEVASGTPEKPEKKLSPKKGKRSRKASKKPRGPVKTYPSVALEKAIKVAQQIKIKNGGNPWSPDQVAASIGMGMSAEFFYVTAASRDYWLTTGTREAKEIALTELGRELVYAGNESIERAKKIEAFHRVELFHKVLAHYKGSDLPEMKYLGNTLEREFGVPPQYHEDFSRVFRENTKYLNITSGDTGLDPLSWTLQCHKPRSLQWQRRVRDTRRSSGVRWWSCIVRAAHSRNLRRSSAAPAGRFVSG